MFILSRVCLTSHGMSAGYRYRVPMDAGCSDGRSQFLVHTDEGTCAL
jgi:hypothetical protein